RVVGDPFLGITFGPAIEVYYLIAVWCFASMVAMYAFSHTPLGRISNAVRDNPERAEFIGYNAQRVRFYVIVASAFFCGIAGGLSAINFEIVTAENVSTMRSGGVLVATFIGGAGFFFGPILGAVIFIFFAVALSDYTSAWQFYLGVFFVLIVMYAPGGVASLIMMNLRVARHGLFGRLVASYAALAVASAVLLAGVIIVVEMSYQLTLNFASGSQLRLFGFDVDAADSGGWVVALALVVVGGLGFEMARRRFARVWSAVQTSIEENARTGAAQ
ncbi:MAG TPA: branched-chain amino acid ABC transporter permease, partial [Zeimonas sp.]